jgi:hypothetical protein
VWKIVILVFGLLNIAGCSAFGIVGDITDREKVITTSHTFTLATTRYRDGDVFAYLNGLAPIYMSSVAATQPYLVRDRWIFPGSGLGEAQKQWTDLKPIDSTELLTGCQKKAIILVHGYWTFMRQSLWNADWVAKLASGGSDLDEPSGTDVYLLSWPAGTYVDDWTYKYSTIVARRTARQLARLIQKVEECHHSEDISVIAHSKGAHLALSLFEQELNAPGRRFDKLILAAPDHSQSDFWDHAPTIAANFKDIYIYNATRDPIVCLGSLMDLGYRDSLGFSGFAKPSTKPNIHIITAPIDDIYGENPGRIHSNYIWNSLSRNDIASLLTEGRSYACRRMSGSLPFEVFDLDTDCHSPLKIPPPKEALDETSIDRGEEGLTVFGRLANLASLTCSVPPALGLKPAISWHYW